MKTLTAAILILGVLATSAQAQQVIAKGSWVAETPDGTSVGAYPTSDACVAGIPQKAATLQSVATTFQNKAANDVFAQREQDLQDEQAYLQAAQEVASANCVQQ